MQTCSPLELDHTLNSIVQSNLKHSIMIWGAPGIGKSAIVRQVASKNQLECIDVRLSQLAPTDLRGLPVPQNGTSTWYPPDFLPTSGSGILFLDEFNMAPPVMMGIAQQLILDRKVGSYSVPEGWFIWAAGNRLEDKASVFKLSAPMANRYLHFEMQFNFTDFKQYAIQNMFEAEIIGFLAFKTELLHKPNEQMAWPSPRTWEMANTLFKNHIQIDSAVGLGAASEFRAYLKMAESIPNLDAIFAGNGNDIHWPSELSIQYAVCTSLALRAKQASDFMHAFEWMYQKANPEFIQIFTHDFIVRIQQIQTDSPVIGNQIVQLLAKNTQFIESQKAFVRLKKQINQLFAN